MTHLFSISSAGGHDIWCFWWAIFLKNSNPSELFGDALLYLEVAGVIYVINVKNNKMKGQLQKKLET